jgi:hypothetical protein
MQTSIGPGMPRSGPAHKNRQYLRVEGLGRIASDEVLSAAVHRIGFDVAESVIDGCEGDSELVILVDGTPLFPPEGEVMGVDPDELFGPGSPLVPITVGRRVVVRSEPSWEQDPKTVEVLIQSVGSRVVWRRPDGSLLLEQPWLVFDRQQYVQELDRFDRDRPVSHLRSTADRFAELLAQRPDVLVPFGYRIDAVTVPSPGGVPTGQVRVQVSRRSRPHRSHTVTVQVPVGDSSEEAARQMLQRLTEVSLWTQVNRRS